MRKRITKYKHLHSNRFRYLYSSIPLISASGLVVVAGLMLTGGAGISKKVNAEEINTMQQDDISSETIMHDEVVPFAEIDRSVSLSLVDPTEGNVLRANATTGNVAYIKQVFNVSAGDEYNIFVQSSTGSSDLVNGATRIPTLDSNKVAAGNIPDNTWGYAVAAGSLDPKTMEYNQMRTDSASPIISKTGGASNQEYTLAFAAKFGEDASAGHYRTNIVLSVAASPEEVLEFPGFEKIDYMQDLTSAQCYHAEIGESKHLIDRRDKKTYRVTKLADGNCWMTESLAYDDPDAKFIESSSGWTTSTNGVYYKNATYGNYYDFTAASKSCPAGWRLPTGNHGGETDIVARLYLNKGIDFDQRPLYLQYGGRINFASGYQHVGERGYYWSSEIVDNGYNNNVHVLNFGPGWVNANAWEPMSDGLLARCLVAGS